MRSNLRHIYTIAQYTFKEILKSKILLNVFLLGVGLFVATYVAFSFTYGEPSRVALDFGMGVLSLSSVGIAIFIGVGLLSSEIDSRTVYMIISRPVNRSNFILGKILGLISILVVNIILLGLLTTLLYFFTGGEYNPLILWCFSFIVIEAIFAMLVVTFFSLLTTPTLSVLMTLVIYSAGHAINETKLTSLAKNMPGLSSVLDFYHFILPAFYKLNLKDFLIYKESLPLETLLMSLSYGVSYALMLVVLCIIVFNKKNLD